MNEFQTIKQIVLKESSDHYTIMILKEGSSICQSLPHHLMKNSIIRTLCHFFNIPFNPNWFYGGGQIHIPK